MPAPGEVDGLVVMGGPMGVYETDKYGFLESECKLIRDLVARGRPVLGVCLQCGTDRVKPVVMGD
jgi:GMP synthase-like glutamine amidotransferase